MADENKDATQQMQPAEMKQAVDDDDEEAAHVEDSYTDVEDHVNYESYSSSDDETVSTVSHSSNGNEAVAGDEFPKIKRRRTTSESSPGSKEKRKSLKSVRKPKITYPWRVLPQRKKAAKDIHHEPSALKEASTFQDKLGYWSLLFSDNLLEKIVLHTNEEIKRRIKPDHPIQAYQHDVTLIELKAVLGLLYILPIFGDVNLEDLWNNMFGVTLLKSTMALRRFTYLLSCLRFDDKSTRDERENTDKFASIREIWNMFMENCKKYYSPGQICSVQRQVLPFKGKCGFRFYSKTVAERYGLKIIMLNDLKTGYMYNAIPFTGAVETENDESYRSSSVRTLCKPIYNSHRSIVCDKWFSSVDLFNKMIQDHNLMMVGEISKNQPEIPDELKHRGERGDAKFLFDQNNALVAFTTKDNNLEMYLSSRHYGKAIDDTGIPDVTRFYREGKTGFKLFNKLCMEYTTVRKTNRWSLLIFMAMLDYARVNAMILNNLYFEEEATSTKSFLRQLAFSLIRPQLLDRLHHPILRKNLRRYLEATLQLDEPEENPPKRNKKCAHCPKTDGRKYCFYCENCEEQVCESHCIVTCFKCREDPEGRCLN